MRHVKEKGQTPILAAGNRRKHEYWSLTLLFAQEIKVDSFVRLGHRLEEELEVPARGTGLAHGARFLAAFELVGGDEERERARRDVEAEAIARLHPREPAPGRGLRCHGH